jgi:hypothetical protein
MVNGGLDDWMNGRMEEWETVNGGIDVFWTKSFPHPISRV